MKSDSFRVFVADQLRELGPVECRAMFGGHGLYHCGAFFGIVYKGQLYFKTDASTRRSYEEQGMPAFRPNARQTLKSYYEVPADVVEDRGQLVAWAAAAVAIARKPGSNEAFGD